MFLEILCKSFSFFSSTLYHILLPLSQISSTSLHCTLNLFCNELWLPCYSLCDSEGENTYIFFVHWNSFSSIYPLLYRKKNQLCISPSNFIRSHTNIKIQCKAPCGFPESFYVLHTYRTYFTVFEKFECFFFLVRFGQRRQKGNQSYRRFRFTRESFYADEIKAQREFFLAIPSSSMFSVSLKSLDTSKSRT